jgi:hypothetical protein
MSCTTLTSDPDEHRGSRDAGAVPDRALCGAHAMTPDDADQVDEQVLRIVGGAPLATWEAACGRRAVVRTRDDTAAPAVLAGESFADGAEPTGTAR